MGGHVTLIRPGLVDYGEALAWQLALRDQLLASPPSLDDPDPCLGYVLALEHPLVVTLGKRGKTEHLRDLPGLRARGGEVFRVDRGGEATLHEPGQLVVYPVLWMEGFSFGIIDLIRAMAAQVCALLGEHGVEAIYDEEHPGVWVQDAPARKIASVGMRLSRGISTHGIAVNLVNDLRAFSLIVPCGMPHAPMTRLIDLIDRDDDVQADAGEPEQRARFDAFERAFLARLETYLGVPMRPGMAGRPARDTWINPLQDC